MSILNSIMKIECLFRKVPSFLAKNVAVILLFFVAKEETKKNSTVNNSHKDCLCRQESAC